MDKQNKKLFFITLICSIVFSSIVAGAVGFWAGSLSQKTDELNLLQDRNIVKVNEESDVVSVVEKVSPAVVSIIITKNLPKIEEYYFNPFGDDDFFNRFFGDDFFNFGIPQYRQNGTEEQEIGGGTGFIITSDGYIVTNKHVVADEEAEYTVMMNDESKYDAEVVARDPTTDFAVLKIEGKDFPTIELGDSDELKVGQTVIAIGNALGEFRNTVSVGVISGLSRSITASSFGFGSENLVGVIQTDASINHGNSGGPLLNLAGQVIGINTAIAQDAQNIGFAIPINEVKNSIESVKEYGKIIKPWLGVRYIMINKSLAESNKLDVDYGALIIRGEEKTDLAVIPGSPADKAGLVENDIILEVNGEKIDQDYPLMKAIAKFKPGDEITLKVLHKGEEKEVKVRLEELKE
jgi:S1-C subfamily serine protease